MDGDIDIEEHDILEHPQVKAVFPDLSKILIQVHTSGDTFLEETAAYSELKDNIFENKLASKLNKDLKEDGLEEHLLEEAVVISDSDGTDTPQLSSEEGSEEVNDDNPITHKVNVSQTDKVNDVEEISTNVIDESQYEAEKIDENADNYIFILPDLNGDVQEISDDEVNNELGHDQIDDEVNGRNLQDNDADPLNVDIENARDDELIQGLENGEDSDESFGDTPLLYEEDKYEGIEDTEQNETGQIFEETPDTEDYQQVCIKEEIEYEPDMSDFDETMPEDRYNDELPPEDIFHFNNKIILGSKPSPQQGILGLVVMLEDWSVFLNNSECYCRVCKTLFPTPNALDYHKMSAHSLLAPMKNRAIKSTAKSSLNVAKKSTAKENVSKKSTAKEMSNSTYCNHCEVSFKDHTTLIKHLYELLPAKQYPCKVCDATFPNQTELVNHSTTHIKLEVPRNILKAKKGNSLLRKMLNTEMKPMNSKALKRKYPTAEKQVSKSMKQIDIEVKSEPTERWSCKVCHDVFSSYTHARRHRITHPEIRARTFMLRKLPNIVSNKIKNKITYEDDKTSKKSNLTKDKPFELIPTSALFQCSKCGVHFSSSSAANSHMASKTCGTVNLWSCPTCKKKIPKRDSHCHVKQHEFSTKLKIYKITKNTYEKTLCRCPKCKVYFEYILLLKHVYKCGKIPSAKCKECKILIPKHKFIEHSKKHDVMKLKAKDFILVDYAVVNDRTKSKPKAKTKSAVHKTGTKDLSLVGKVKSKVTVKTEPGLKQPNILKKLKFEKEKSKLYYCAHCKCYFFRTHLGLPKNNHVLKKCKTQRKLTSICKLCGLQVYNKILECHEKLHMKKKLTVQDFEFYDYATRKPITPPIPQYPSCKKCQIHFLNSKMIAAHICGEDYENCEVCGEKFENSALKMHLPLHQLAKKPTRQPILPELMMKYESLNAIWNILFVCGKCELVTDLYDSAVEHSQGHRAKNAQPHTIKCYICNLKFDESCWAKHSELHSRMPIKSKNFRILRYSPDDLLEESWFQMFENLPEKETRQIIDRSVFGTERSLKMALVADGLPEFTLYCCSECGLACGADAILQHASDDCADTHSECACAECDVAFLSAADLYAHRQLHEKGIKKDEFRIVRFIKNSEDRTKKSIANVKIKAAKNQIEDIKPKVTDKDLKYNLYKCLQCKACILKDSSRAYHNCGPKRHQVYCKLCKQNFPSRSMTVHRAKHTKQHDFRAQNIRVVDFEPIPEGQDKPSKFKRSTKMEAKRKSKALVDRNSTQTKRISESLESSSLVNEVTPRSTRNSNRTTNDSHTEQTDKRTGKLYKCECGLHYISLQTAQKHLNTCDGTLEESNEICSRCGLLFPTDLLVAHLCRHHSLETELIVEPLPPIKVTKSKTKTSPTPDRMKLYKCSVCDVYYLNQNTCYKHALRHTPLDSIQYIQCKLCGLQFTILSLHVHVRRHHQNPFPLEKVLVEEYQPSVGRKAPSINIFYASERLQNVQEVSSTND